jgi:hypothetical protein
MKLPLTLRLKRLFDRSEAPVTTSRAGVFISYRRNDQAGFAGRLADELDDSFGKDKVFRDVESIAPGENFILALNKSLDVCSALLVIIGPAWLDEKNTDGKSRIFSEKDWVRAELEMALVKNKKIFPILVNGATMPVAAQLPQQLHKILEFNAHEVSDKRWDYDVKELVRELSKIPGLEPLDVWKEKNPEAGIINKLKQRGKLAIAMTGLFALLTLSVAGYVFLGGSRHCNEIYGEQFTSLSERIKNIREIAKGSIKRSRLNQLSDSAKSAALNLKTCCIILDKKQITSEQYFQCKSSADEYSSKLEELLVSLNEANENREEKKTFGVFSKQTITEEKLNAIENKLDELLLVSRVLDEDVSRLKNKVDDTSSTIKKLSDDSQDSQQGEIQLEAVYASTDKKIDERVQYYLYSVEKNANGKREEIANSNHKSTASFTVPPGTYHLWVGYGKASVETRLEVKSGKLTQQTMTIPVGHIKLDAAYQETDKKIDEKVQYHLYSVEKNVKGKRDKITHSDYKPTARFTVPPGTYHLWVGYGKASVETRLEVKSGKATEKTILLQKGDNE